MSEEQKNPHYVTPEEAANGYCPFPVQNGPMWRGCFGPKCMAWRWYEEFQNVTQIQNGKVEIVGKRSLGRSTTHGYCGMVRS